MIRGVVVKQIKPARFRDEVFRREIRNAMRRFARRMRKRFGLTSLDPSGDTESTGASSPACPAAPVSPLSIHQGILKEDMEDEQAEDLFRVSPLSIHQGILKGAHSTTPPQRHVASHLSRSIRGY